MVSKSVQMIAVLAVVVVAAAAAAVLFFPEGDQSGPDYHDDGKERYVPILPDGVSFDAGKGRLYSSVYSEWEVTDELTFYSERKATHYEGSSIVLDEGYYSIVVGDERFDLIVEGTLTKSSTWSYKYNGQSYDVGVRYDIDVLELANVVKESREFNSRAKYSFEDLPSIVYVNDTVRSIEKQMETLFKGMGGSVNDRQEFADFLASFPQLTLTYFNRLAEDEETQRWGSEEYWANTLETLYFQTGDCEDFSAVACALFKAAGYDAGMIGVGGHVTAALTLDDFEPWDVAELKKITNLSGSMTCTPFHAYNDSEGTGPLYYGVETIKKQVPAGYVLNSTAKDIGGSAPSWASFSGRYGVYPVD